jgi:hypothetical protein
VLRLLIIRKYTRTVAPCVLCWYQRIAIFPLVLILPMGLFPFDAKAAKFALPPRKGTIRFSSLHPFQNLHSCHLSSFAESIITSDLSDLGAGRREAVRLRNSASIARSDVENPSRGYSKAHNEGRSYPKSVWKCLVAGAVCIAAALARVGEFWSDEERHPATTCDAVAGLPRVLERRRPSSMCSAR